MMAGLGTAGALLLVLLAAVSYGYPAKKGSDPSYSGGPVANPASSGSSWEGHSSGGPVPAASGSIASPAPAPGVLHTGSGPSQPGLQWQPAAAPGLISYAAPAYPGYGGPSAGSFQPASASDITWAVDPPTFYSGDSRPGAERAFGSPQASGPSHVSPPVYPQYQGGELSQYEGTFEDGNSESETEEQGFLPPFPYAASLQVSSFDSPSSVPGGFYPSYPYPYDYMFLTGQYPPGTYTHSSSSFEQGDDYWHDTHYRKYHYPAYPSTQQVVIPPLDPPKGGKQPKQPQRQNTGGTSYDWRVATSGPSQPHGGAGRWRRPAGGSGSRKVGRML